MVSDAHYGAAPGGRAQGHVQASSSGVEVCPLRLGLGLSWSGLRLDREQLREALARATHHAVGILRPFSFLYPFPFQQSSRGKWKATRS